MLGPKPPDVADYVAQTPAYATGTTATVLGDGSNAFGGVMPIEATQLTDIPTVGTDWIGTGGTATDIPVLANGEAKARFVANFSHFAYADPIRHYGQPGAGHLHMFFGSRTTNAFSTYASLRNQANLRSSASKVASTAAGGPENASAYWAPAFTKNGYAIPPGSMVIYYESNPATEAQYNNRVPRGTRLITGRNPDDPDDLLTKAELAIAEAATPGRYTYGGDGFIGYTAYAADRTTVIQTAAASDYSQFIKDTDGSDPWNGAIAAAGWIKVTLKAPKAYDGRNLHADGGFKHFRHAFGDTHGLGIPEGWFHAPELLITIWYKHNGWADLSQWELASDAMYAATLGRAIPTGWSMHMDWMIGWDDDIFNQWNQDCLGVDASTPHTCDSSTFNAAEQRLIGGFLGENAPDGSRTPQCSIEEYDSNNTSELVPIPVSPTASFSTNAVAA